MLMTVATTMVQEPQLPVEPSSQFNPKAWDHWLLIGVVFAVSVWTLRTSWQWRQEWRLQETRSSGSRP